jgi:hypothetical protein
MQQHNWLKVPGKSFEWQCTRCFDVVVGVTEPLAGDCPLGAVEKEADRFVGLSDLDLAEMLHAVKLAGFPEDKPFAGAILVEVRRRAEKQPGLGKEKETGD